MAEAATGAVRVEKVRGRSALTRCFARYPLKLIAPSKVGPASCDAVWLYALTYGGGIVSGDTISCTVSVGDGCTAAITTQASTKVLLEQGSTYSIAEQMQEYNVIAMVVLLGPKLKSIQEQMQAEVRKLMSGQLRPPTSGGSLYTMRSQPPQRPQRPPLVASCSQFGRMGTGMVARIAAVSTELVYSFLRHHLAALEPSLGASPYAAS
ncbi:Urease accessory protein D [Dichanthelium oligosanthes]|uniref:Urease accessory protein D n=1 Tax=Dichanthelium oligosanthes TaxID=888268 RepID=A0A1E5VS17_9POAL|nr:Urease accessory protein D [Dichanthelium oligosanthes]